MPRYLEVASDARKVIQEVLNTVPEPDRPFLAVKLAKIYNLGIRTSPRAVQSTVRLNAVRRAMESSPVRVTMTQVPKTSGVGTFNALTLTPITPVTGPKSAPDVEGATNDEE